MAEVSAELSDAGDTIALHVGDALTIRLPELQTAGYQWVVDTMDSAILALRGSRYTAPQGALAGAAGSREIVVGAVAPGATPLRLASRRSWETGKPAAQQFGIIVTVS